MANRRGFVHWGSFEKIIARFIFDDVALSFRTTEEGLEFYFESKKYLKEGSFESRRWNSNNKELMDKTCIEENGNSYEQGKNCLGLEGY